jgi:CelD/BcsL family acetyltransferase involved in cellulose biosynthesis
LVKHNCLVKFARSCNAPTILQINIFVNLHHLTRKTNKLKNNSNNQSEHVIADLRISVSVSLPAVKAEWQNLERRALCSYFQSYEWCESWIEVFGHKHKTTPLIVVARSLDGETQFILPMQIRRRFGCRILEWLCQPENNYGFGIFSLQNPKENFADWFGDNFTKVLATLPTYDVAALENMPLRLLGNANPLVAINRFASADQSFFTNLKPDFDTLHETKRTARSISKIRRRDERLLELGPLELEVSNIASENDDALHEIIHYKSAQLAELGVRNFPAENITTFFKAIQKHNAPVSSLYVFRLLQSGRTISGLIGARYGDTFWLMILTMAPNGPAQFSPGDYVLRKSIAWACENGLKFYDFGVGYSNYKEHWADNELQLYNYYAAKNLKGLPLAAFFMVYNFTKRIIKNTAAIKSFVFQSRKWLRGKKAD